MIMKVSRHKFESAIIFFLLFQQLWSPLIICGIINDILVFISKIVSLITIAKCLALSVSKRSLLKLPILVGIVYCSLLLSTILGGGDIRRWASMFYYPVGLSALFSINLCYGTKQKSFIQAISSLMMIICLMEFLFVVFFPLGLNTGKFERTYFLGGENMVGFTLMIGLIIVLCDKFVNNTSPSRVYVYLSMQCLTIGIIFSGGNFVGTIITVILLFAGRKLLKKISTEKLILSVALIFIYLIVLNNLTNLITHPFVRYIIEDNLGKDLTLTHRTIIWDQVIYGFYKHPFWGHGIRETVNLFTIPTGNIVQTFSAHNQWLQSMYEGGVFFYLMLIPLLHRVSCLLKHTEVLLYFNATIIGLMTMYMTEAPGVIYLIVLLSLGYSVGYYINNEIKIIQRGQPNYMCSKRGIM